MEKSDIFMLIEHIASSLCAFVLRIIAEAGIEALCFGSSQEFSIKDTSIGGMRSDLFDYEAVAQAY